MSKSRIEQNFSKEELKLLIQESTTQIELIKKLGYNDIKNIVTLKKVINNWGLVEEFELLKIRSKQYQNEQIKQKNIDSKIPFNNLFCENSNHCRSIVLRRILKENLIPYKCSICGNKGKYFGKSLILQLDHINGISNDHRLENLRFLCPNCHSQTDTYANRDVEGQKKKKLESNIKKAKKEAESKVLFEKKKKDFLEVISQVDTSKHGWIQEVQKILNVSHTQVSRLVKKYASDLDIYNRTNNIQKIKDLLEKVDFDNKNWLNLACDELNLNRSTIREIIKNKLPEYEKYLPVSSKYQKEEFINKRKSIIDEFKENGSDWKDSVSKQLGITPHALYCWIKEYYPEVWN